MIKREQIQLVPHGKQKKGKSEYGLLVLNKVKRPLGELELNEYIHKVRPIPDEWEYKIPIFWGTIHTSQQTIDSNANAQFIPIEQSWVKGMVLSMGLWHVESFPIDDVFSPNRLSAEIVKVPWWRWYFYKLIGKDI